MQDINTPVKSIYSYLRDFKFRSEIQLKSKKEKKEIHKERTEYRSRILINRIRLICFETMKVDFDYDAFVICNPEGKDLEFVNNLVDTMQGSPYNLKLCAPWRNVRACSPNTRECIRDRYSTGNNYNTNLFVNCRA